MKTKTAQQGLLSIPFVDNTNNKTSLTTKEIVFTKKIRIR